MGLENLVPHRDRATNEGILTGTGSTMKRGWTIVGKLGPVADDALERTCVGCKRIGSPDETAAVIRKS